MSVVLNFNASLSDVAPFSPISLSVGLMKMGNNGLFMDTICVLFLFSSPSRLSFLSVVFDFNISLIDFIPLSSILFPVDLIRIEKSGLLMGAMCVVPDSPLRSSFVSVVFDFNTSLNDVTPMYPMLMPVCLMKMEMGELLMDAIYVCCFFLFSPLRLR